MSSTNAYVKALLNFEDGREFIAFPCIHLADITADQPIARRVANRDATISDGWRMDDAITRRINNVGFVNAEDYSVQPDRPIIAMIGDSQIEAPRVAEDQTVHAIVRHAFNGREAVYTFAMSGAPLTQYAVWAEAAETAYKPQSFIFFISPNDFVESFARFGLFEGFRYLNFGNGDLLLTLRSYRRGIASYAAEYSHLVSYLLHNLDLPNLIRTAFGQTTRQLSASELTRLFDWFFTVLNKIDATPAKVVFVLNPADPSIYHAADCAESQIVNPDYDAFRKAATTHGYAVYNAEPTFCNHHRQLRARLVGPDGEHWNANGHEAMARLIFEILASR